jgi:hypothetical protein
MVRRLAGPALALLLAASMVFYVVGVLIPYQVRDAGRTGVPRGNLSDLYPRWLGAKEMVEQGRDPYSLEVSRDIQRGYYGRELDPRNPADPKDQQGFAYPVYVTFLLWPTFGLPFSVVQDTFFWLLLALTALSVPLWVAGLRLRFEWPALLAATLLAVGSFPTAQGVALQQLSLLVAVMLAGCAALIARGWLIPAGVLLALATIKPQVTAPLAAWWLLWVVSDWRRRQGLAWSFGGTMLVLLAGSEWLSPGWLGRFRQALADYQTYTSGRSLVDTLFTPIGGAILTGVLVLLTAAYCWRVRREPAGEPGYRRALALVPAVTLVIIPTWAPYNQVLLLPALLLLWGEREVLAQVGRPARYAAFIVGLLVGWPWIASQGLMLASLVLPATTVQSGWTLPIWTSLFIPFAVLAALGPWIAAGMRPAQRPPL